MNHVWDGGFGWERKEGGNDGWGGDGGVSSTAQDVMEGLGIRVGVEMERGVRVGIDWESRIQ